MKMEYTWSRNLGVSDAASADDPVIGSCVRMEGS